MITQTITTEQKIKATLAPVTATGKPAKLDGKPSWVADGPSTLAISEDGLSCDLISSDEPSTTVVTIKADADLGAGVEEIIDIIELVVEGARAAALGLTLGSPEPK